LSQHSRRLRAEAQRHAAAQAQKLAQAQQKPVEWRTEQHFYSMPDTCEMFLAATRAIQDYYMWLAKRHIRAEVTLHSPSESLDFLVPTIWDGLDVIVHDVIRDTSGLTLGEFDQVVKFDPVIAYEQSCVTEKHVVQMFGMMVGSDPVKVLPDVSSVTDKMQFNPTDILLYNFSGSEEVREFLLNNRPDLKITLSLDDEELIALQAHLVVGVRSGATYLAASAGRAVIEIYPTDKHRNWLSKWTNPCYQMIYADEPPATLVYRAVETIWKRVEQRQRAMQAVSV
jgi:hypothetical protein